MGSRLQDVILRGTAASKPLATAVAPGTQYFSTDTQVTERSDGAVWQSYSAVGVTPPAAHAPSHSSGGSDPVTVTALAGYPGGASTFLRADHTFAAPTGVTPAPHAATHSIAGSDPVAILGLAGYPGGTTSFLRADGTFAAPPGGSGGVPAAHHATHETGGADAITALDGAVIATGTVAAARLGAHHTSHETGGADAITALAASVIATGTIAPARLPARTGMIAFVIDGGASVITPGVKGADLYIPFACTITASTLTADVAGSVVLNLLLSAAFGTVPTVSIVASAPPTLASAAASQDTALTGWTVAVPAGSRLRYSVTSASTIVRLTHTLTITVP